LASVGLAFAQDYPTQPVRIITAAAGATNDLTARSIQPQLTELLGQPVVIENRGGSAVIPVEAVVRAQPDGHTLLLFGAGVWQLAFMQDLPYDPVTDLVPVTMVTTAPVVLVVNPSLGVETLEDLIAMAKADPGQLRYGSGASGGITHLSAELFKEMAGVEIERIAYEGASQAATAVLSGEVHMAFVGVNTARPHVEADALNALAVTSAQPSSVYPDVPTIGSVVPGYEASTVQGIFAPAGTPDAIIDRLNQDIVQVLQDPEVALRFQESGAEVVGSTPEEFAAYIASDRESMGKVIEAAAITSQ
jgi:tripartite-type tricarboxylate transporter receptor subunit TctC